MHSVNASSLGISPGHISPTVLHIIDELNSAGFEAYVVGGSVRDLLMRIVPKDFDVATSATPQQIKQLFGKRCRIIGRRFELAHIYGGRDIIEVATFRAPPKPQVKNEAGMITRDNVWGTIEQDYKRRDLTINALYYHPQRDVILDFSTGIADIEQRCIRFLGNPQTRIEEDPVRMIRLLRFAAKLGFGLSADIESIFTPDNTRLLMDVSPHRLFDEMQKLFMGGYVHQVMPLLLNYHVWPSLFGKAIKISPLLDQALRNTDARIGQGKTVNPAFLLAVLLWEQFLVRLKKLTDEHLHLFPALTQAALMTLAEQDARTAIPRYLKQFIREVWELQFRMLSPRAKHIPHLFLHPRFRAAHDLMLLRNDAGEQTVAKMSQWWQVYREGNNDSREQLIKEYSRERQRTSAHREGLADFTEQVAWQLADVDEFGLTTDETTAAVSVDGVDIGVGRSKAANNHRQSRQSDVMVREELTPQRYHFVRRRRRVRD